jgi:PTS system cellobiose-specific IIA component
LNAKERENIIIQIISYAGEARSKAYEALDTYIENGDFKRAERLLEEARDCLIEAGKVHAKFLHTEAGGEKVEMTLLLVHSEDLYMNASTEIDLTERIILALEHKRC